MKLKSLRMKITLLAGICLLCIAGIIIVFSAVAARERAETERKEAIREARKYAGTVAMQHSNAVRVKLEKAIDTAQTLAQVLSGIREDLARIEYGRDGVNTMLKIVLEKNPDFLAVYTCWEPDAFDQLDAEYVSQGGHDETGRFIPCWTRDGNGNITVGPLKAYETEGLGDYYRLPRESGKECILNPYISPLHEEPVLITSVVVPVMTDEKFLGIVGIHLRLDILQWLVDKSGKFYGSEQISLISNNGILAAVSGKPEMAGDNMRKLHPEHFKKEMTHVREGKKFIGMQRDHFDIFMPLKIGHTETPWSLSIIVPVEKITAAADEKIRRADRDIRKMTIIGIICIFSALAFLWYIAGNIAKPLSKTSYMLKEIAAGDLTGRIDIASADEMGRLAKWFNIFLDNFQEIIRDIANSVETLNTSSRNLSDISGKMSSGTDDISTRSSNVASSTEEMSTNINTMASASEEMSVNVQSVSSTAEEMALNMNSVVSAIDEMSEGINEIALSAQKGASVSTEAMDMSKTATGSMNTLGDTAMEIDEVTEVIKKIAEQTNLLALNATIEAASAGDAGRGFAVVAKEIKELASQSSQAAENIAKRIKDVQKNTIEAVKVIDKVSDIINSINESSTVIMKAIEQQTQTANDISANVRQVNTGASNIALSIAEIAKGSNDMSMNAGEAAKGANDVAGNIQSISEVAANANDGATQINQSARKLAEVAGELQKMVSKFKIRKEQDE